MSPWDSLVEIQPYYYYSMLATFSHPFVSKKDLHTQEYHNPVPRYNLKKKKIQSINLVSIFYRWFQQQPRDKKARFCATNIHRIENHLAIRNNKEKTWILKYKSSGPWVFIVWTRKDGMQATFWWIDMYDNFVLWEIEFAHFTHAKSTAACQRSALFVYKGRWFFFCCCATKCGLDRSVCLNL